MKQSQSNGTVFPTITISCHSAGANHHHTSHVTLLLPIVITRHIDGANHTSHWPPITTQHHPNSLRPVSAATFELLAIVYCPRPWGRASAKLWWLTTVKLERRAVRKLWCRASAKLDFVQTFNLHVVRELNLYVVQELNFDDGRAVKLDVVSYPYVRPNKLVLYALLFS